MESKKINFEKISVYIACLGFLFMFWQSQMNIKDSISDLSERVRALEVKVEHLEDHDR